MKRILKPSIGYQIQTLDPLPEINKPHSHHKPINLRLYINGDQYFPGKKINITPDRYTNFNEFLGDLTRRLVPGVKLPHGVRQIFTPITGRRVFDLDDLSDGEMCVCAGFEGFKMMKYGQSQLQPWSLGQRWRNKVMQLKEASESHGSSQYLGYANNAFHPSGYFHTSQSTQLRKWPGMFGASQRRDVSLRKSNNFQHKPRIITIVRNGINPKQHVKILLNHQAMQSYEQLLADISGAFLPHLKNYNIQRLFTVRGKEVAGISDFFREDDIFIAQVSGEPDLKKNEVISILEEIFPDSNVVKLLLRDWRKNQRNSKNSCHESWGRTLNRDYNLVAANQKVTAVDCSVQEKRDSGFDSGDSTMNWPESDHAERPNILRPRKRLGRKMGRESKREGRKHGNSHQDVASSVNGQRRIEKMRNEDFNTDKEHVRNQKDVKHETVMKKVDDTDKRNSLISFNKINNNLKLIDDSGITNDRKLKSERERIKE
ncbi:unnamed protein product, partial [Candidula unifasciata]